MRCVPCESPIYLPLTSGPIQSEVPENWRAAALSKVELPSKDDLHYLPGCYYRDADFCFLDDTSEGEYVDLTLNPERFTGYSGPSANRSWSSIYQENCFKPPAELSLSEESQCLEERVYYKIISGTLSTISILNCSNLYFRSACKYLYTHLL